MAGKVVVETSKQGPEREKCNTYACTYLTLLHDDIADDVISFCGQQYTTILLCWYLQQNRFIHEITYNYTKRDRICINPT